MKSSRLKFALLSLLAVVLLNIVFSFTLTMINGPHPECGVNREVGSCDLIGASLNSAGWNIVPTFVLWLFVLLIGFIVIWKKHGTKHKIVDGLLLAFIALPIVMMAISLLFMLLSLT